MATILNSAMLDSATTILDSDTLLSSLRFAQKHSHSTLTLNQTNSIWLKLIQFSPNLMMAAILNSANLNSTLLDSAILAFSLKLTHTCHNWFPPFAQRKFHSFILTQIDDGSHLEICHVGFRHCHLGFSHLIFSSQTHPHLPWCRLVPTISKTLAKKNFTHSSLIQLDDGSKILSLMSMLDSDTAMMDSAILLSSLRFTQKHSHSNLTLTQTNSIWLKLIHSHLTWWWQPSWILPSWIHPFWHKTPDSI